MADFKGLLTDFLIGGNVDIQMVSPHCQKPMNFISLQRIFSVMFVNFWVSGKMKLKNNGLV